MLKSIRKLRDFTVRHKVRIDVIIVSAVFFLSSGLLYITPEQTQSYVPPAAFFQTSRQDWFFAGYLVVPAGDTLGCSFQSNTAMVVAFANSSSWDGYLAGNTSSLEILSSSSGVSGSFAFHATNDSHIALIAFWNPQNMDYFKVILTAYNYNVLRPYAELTLWLGVVALSLAFGYERLRAMVQAIRSGRS